MQSLTLYKDISSHDVAHLYEHIYFIHLDTKLREAGYFWSIDYSIEDATTTSGLVKIYIENYTNGLINLREVIKLEIDFLMEITEIAIGQLASEYIKDVYASQPDQLIKDLQKIHATKWTIGPKLPKDKIKVNNNILTVGEEIGSTELLITFIYPDISKELLPLYRQVAGLTLNIVICDIADTYAGFIPSEAFQTNDMHQLEGVIRFANYKKIDVDAIIKATIAEIKTAGGYDRLLAILTNIDATYNAPSPENTFRDLGIKMNAKKWKQIATQENLEIVLRSLSYTSKTS